VENANSWTFARRFASGVKRLNLISPFVKTLKLSRELSNLKHINSATREGALATAATKINVKIHKLYVQIIAFSYGFYN
jgi:hypothetical protein